MTASPEDATAQEQRDRERQDHQHGAKGAGTNFLTLAGQTSLLLFQMLGARLFGAAVWGAYAFGLSVLEICARLGLAGADKGILIFVAARRATGDVGGAERAVATGIRLSIVLGVTLAAGVAAASGSIGRYYGQPMFGRALLYLAPAIPVLTLTTVLLASTMARKTLRYNLIVRGLTEPALRVSLVAAVGLAATGIGALASVHVIAAGATLVVAVWAFSRLYSVRHTVRGVLRGALDRPLLRYSPPLAAAEFVNSFLAQTDVLILGKFRPAAEVGIYAACVVLGTAVSFVRGAFDTVLAPVAAEAWAQSDRARLASNLKLYSRMVLLFATPLCGLLIVGGPALLSLYGPAFVRGGLVVAMLASAHLINASMGLAGWVLMASGRSKTILANNGIVFALNVVLCLVLVPRLGMEGAALSVLISIAVLHVIQSTEAYLIAGAQPLSRGFARLLVIGAAVVGGELLLYRTLGGNALLRAGALTIAGAPVFLGLAWLLGSTGDRALLAGMLRRRPRERA